MWAKRLLRAKFFVVMTEKESAIMFDGANPDEFTDLLALTSQAAELELFKEKLQELIDAHTEASAKLTGVSIEKKVNRVRRSPSKTSTKTGKQSR